MQLSGVGLCGEGGHWSLMGGIQSEPLYKLGLNLDTIAGHGLTRGRVDNLGISSNSDNSELNRTFHLISQRFPASIESLLQHWEEAAAKEAKT